MSWLNAPLNDQTARVSPRERQTRLILGEVRGKGHFQCVSYSQRWEKQAAQEYFTWTAQDDDEN